LAYVSFRLFVVETNGRWQVLEWLLYWQTHLQFCKPKKALLTTEHL
jgi:hypothetical protein